MKVKVLRKRQLKAGKPTAFWPAVEPGTPVLALHAAHCGFDKPEVIEERCINLEAAPDAQDADFEAELPNTCIFQQFFAASGSRVGTGNRLPASGTPGERGWQPAPRGPDRAPAR